MKVLLLLFCFFAVVPNAWGKPPSSQNAQIIRGPTFEGMVFTPELLPHPTTKDPNPLVAAIDFRKKITYWTPSDLLVRKAEKAFAEIVSGALQKLPPDVAHDHDYYTPKGPSRDWQPQIPDDFNTNFLYSMDWSLTPRAKRQYIGVTVGDKKMLVMNFVYTEPFLGDNPVDKEIRDSWPHQWVYIDDAGIQVFYDLKTGKFTKVDT